MPNCTLHSNHLLTFSWGAAGHLPGVLSSLLFEAYALVLGLCSPPQDTSLRGLGQREESDWEVQRQRDGHRKENWVLTRGGEN